MMPKPEPWLLEWIAALLARHPEIEQVYFLGNQARGPYGQKPNYSLLFYAGYERALGLLMALAREEDDFRPDEGIVHLYAENYGATLCGIWGGALIPNEINHDRIENSDYKLWAEVSKSAQPLQERLSLPLERRRDDRRGDALTGDINIEAAFTSEEPATMASKADDAAERRERQDRRRDVWDLMPLLED